jgi:hypothetical protein
MNTRKMTAIVTILVLVAGAIPFNTPVKADAGYDITELKVVPASIQEQCLNITISVKVKNIGDALGRSITLKFLVGSIDIGSKVMTNLSAGGESSTNLTWTIPRTFSTGKVNISVSIDGYAVRKDISYSIVECRPYLSVDFAKDARGRPYHYSTGGQSGKTAALKISIVLYNSGCIDATNVSVVILSNSDGKQLGKATGIIARAHETVNQTIDIRLKTGNAVKLIAEATYGNVTTTNPAADASTASVRSGGVGCVSIAIIATVFFPMVVMSRRKKLGSE